MFFFKHVRVNLKFFAFQASESLLLACKGRLPSWPYLGTVGFALSTSILAYLYNKKKRLRRCQLKKNENREIAFTALETLIGKEETAILEDGGHEIWPQSLDPKGISAALFAMSDKSTSICCHKDSSCLEYALKVTFYFRSWNVILIKSSYDIFSRMHFFAFLENWVNCASFGATVTRDMSHLS